MQQGGSLSISGSIALNGNAVTGGAGGMTNPGLNPPSYALIFEGHPGKAFGSGIFLQGNDSVNGGSGTLVLSPAAGQSQTISDTIADQTGSGGLPNAANPSGLSVNYSGNWGITLNGAGTVILSGANTYSGGTALNSGTLQVNNATGSGTGSGPVNVAAGATLGGTGSIASSVTVQTEGALAPGNGIGTLTVGGNVTWSGSSAGASTANFTLGNSSATASKLVVTGSLLKGSGSTFQFNFGGTGQTGTAYTLATFSGTTFAVTGFSATNLAPGVTGAFELSGTTLQFLTVGPPTIGQTPTSVTVATGRSAAFSVAATGLPAPAFQWNLNAVPIAGATDAILLVSGATSANAGTYTCTVGNSFGSVTSSPATLSVIASTTPGFLTNISARGYVGTGINTLVGGFGIAGSGSKEVLIRGIGPGLNYAFGPFSGVVGSPQLALFNSSQAQIAQNAGWGGTSILMTAFSTVGAFALSPSSRDTALLTTLTVPPTGYTAQVASGLGGDGTGLAEVYDADSGAPTIRLINISARALVKTGQNILIGGFTIGGNTGETVLIRAVGPGMTDTFQIAGTLAQPVLTIFSGNTPIYSNTNWGGDATLAGTFATTGAFTLNPAHQDSALLLTLPPGGYTAQVTGFSGGTGIALVEIYEVY